MMTDDDLKAALAASPDERVNEDYMTSRIVETKCFRVGHTVTVCQVVLDNGYTVLGQSACVDPANYNASIGEQLAYDDVIRQLWPLFGFLLAEKRFRIKE